MVDMDMAAIYTSLMLVDFGGKTEIVNVLFC